MKKIVISACLIGEKCRYNGLDSKSQAVMNRFEEGSLIQICPEQMGGLSTPRPAAEIVGGDGADVIDGKARVITVDGEDKTAAFLAGAYRALESAQAHRATHAILKSKSPSCGCGKIYDGSFTGKLTDNDGVTAALFRRHGIKIMTEEDLENEA